MAKIVSHVRLMVLVYDKAPDSIVDKWVEGFEANAERINKNRKAILNNELAFSARVANISSRAYANSLNPNFISKSGQNAKDIIARQSANLKTSFEKYQDSLDYAFETVDGVPGKRFKDRVKKRKKHFAERIAKKVLPYTGCKPGQAGLIQIAGKWLTDDPTVEGILRGGDDIQEGGPLLITTKDVAPTLKATLAGRLQQAGIAMTDSNNDPAILKSQNDRTNALVQRFVDSTLALVPFTTDGASHIDFIVVEGRLFLDIQVSQA